MVVAMPLNERFHHIDIPAVVVLVILPLLGALAIAAVLGGWGQ